MPDNMKAQRYLSITEEWYNTTLWTDPSQEDHFESISDFKECMRYNGEVEFEWNGKTYNIVHAPDAIVIYDAYKGETERYCKSADEVLEYLIDGVRLREIITQVEVVCRTI